MIQCQNCGQVNNYASNFCRFCGTKFLVNQISNDVGGNNFEQSPPLPYSWKTDEFQITDLPKQKSRQINRVQPLGNQNPFAAQMPQAPQPLTYQKPLQQNMADNLHCPRCGSQAVKYERRVSTAGWIVFAALLVTTGIFCWIGLLIKEDVKICRVCNYKIG